MGKYFNPRSRTGSDHVSDASFPGTEISTHAPAQGATPHVPGYHGKNVISTHAPAQGATEIRAKSQKFEKFQPTLPHRERLLVCQQEILCKEISTHAPAQGATASFSKVSRSLSLISTHAPAQGATRIYVRRNFQNYISTHAPAQGATAKGYKKHPFILCKTEKNLLDNFFKDILIQKIV